MNLRYGTGLSVLILFSPGTSAIAANPDRGAPADKLKAQALVNYSKLPLSFEENQGQADAQVKFLSRGNGYSILLTPAKVILNLQSNRKTSTPSTVVMSFPGAGSAPAIGGVDRQMGVSSYFVGNDPRKWVRGAPNYARVQYQSVYPGVDLAFYGKHGQLEYDFVVAPGADPRCIRLRFDGVDGMLIDPEGSLVLGTPDGEIRQHKPIVYQESAGGRQTLAGRYVIQPDKSVAFEIAGYDTRAPLVIDPALTFGSYLGSPGEEVFGISSGANTSTYPAVAVDASQNTYITGYNGSTASSFTGNPTVLTSTGPEPGGGAGVFVVKMNSTGTGLFYSVVFGGGLTDVGGGIAVDPQGNAYVTGYASSPNFPITTGAAQTILNGGNNTFITKLNSTGTQLIYSTFLGGSGNFWGRAIAVDRSGNAYVTGTALASVAPGAIPFPLVSPLSSDPASSGFLTEVSADGSEFLFSTYLSAGIGYGIALDSLGAVFVTGSTASAVAPSPAQGYVLKINAGGTTVGYGPLLLGHSGANMQTIGFGIAVDEFEDAFVTGMTNDTSFPQLAAAAQGTYGGGLTDGFALKLDPNGNVVYGTYIGGLGSNILPERGSAIGVDTLGNAYVSGSTQCIAFPTVNTIPGARNGGSQVLMKGTVSGSKSNWANTTLGGSFDQVTALAFDSSGNLYAGASSSNASGGGIFKQASGTSTWSSVSVGITSTTIDSIAVDPASSSTVYAAGGGHLFKTTNGGTSWTGLLETIGTQASIAIAKTSPLSTIYVGSSLGLIYSTDGGFSWSSTSVPVPLAVVVDPNSPLVAYAGGSSGIYQTTNGGGSWTAVNGNLPTGLGGIVSGMAVYAGHRPSTVYAALPNGVFYTTNAATGWTLVKLPLELDSTPHLVAVDAGDQVYLAFSGGGIATAASGGTLSSEWSALTYNGLTQNQIMALATPPTGSGTAYAGIVAATTAFLTEISPTGTFLSSTCIGGTDNNLGQSIAVTPGGNIFLSGLTIATNFPTTPNAVRKTSIGLYDAFAARVDNVIFDDVPPTDPFFNFINLMYEKGITSGCSASPPDYCPDSTTTRGQMAVFIITSMFGGSSFSYTTTPYFNDVPVSNGFFKFIQKMTDLGITAGCGSNNFCPDDSISRAQMAVFIIAARYGTIPFTYPTTPYFTDVPSTSPYFPFVQKMAQLGITAGCKTGYYCPDDSLTRGQMAVFIDTGLLEQLVPATLPLITQVMPNTASQGDTLTVSIYGLGTHFDSSTQVTLPTGITPSNLTVLSPTSLTVQFNISPSAVPSLTATNGSLYTIAVTTGSEEADLPNAFTVH